MTKEKKRQEKTAIRSKTPPPTKVHKDKKKEASKRACRDDREPQSDS